MNAWNIVVPLLEGAIVRLFLCLAQLFFYNNCFSAYFLKERVAPVRFLCLVTGAYKPLL
jgi:hypothetical protein